ncbi:MAG TPA: radical SAM protein, partial [Planctomycetaceae bacterium]|nr:radical SAM protein [Planctomycetaceae bacterium]
MYWHMARRALFDTDKRLLWRFLRIMLFRAIPSVLKHKRRMKRGEYFPPFLFIAVTNSCNLRCQGCWMDVTAKQTVIPLEAMNRLIREAQTMGNAFFGIVGGEPLLHPQLLEIFEQNPNCYFQLFTNGHYITDEVARELHRLGNVTPLVSIEGKEIVSDQRRGRRGVFSRSMQGLQTCLRHRLLTGVATSVCQSNIDELVTEEWVDRLIEMGVFYTWFYVYRPMGPKPRPDLCLTPEQQVRVRRFV